MAELVVPEARASKRIEQLPNLVPLPTMDLQVGRADESNEPAVRFSTEVTNRGDYSFELFGRPTGATLDELEAEQCVGWGIDHACVQRRSVGRLIYHDVHEHYHFDNFALYELRRLLPGGRVDMSVGGLVSVSRKVSFCLGDGHRVEESALTAPWPLYVTCQYGGLGVQGISPGWADIYRHAVFGQYVSLKGVPDGTYALVITTDPGERVFESDDSDNVAVTGFRLFRNGTLTALLCTNRPGRFDCDRSPIGE